MLINTTLCLIANLKVLKPRPPGHGYSLCLLLISRIMHVPNTAAGAEECSQLV